ncbi:MAG: DUF4331 family protein [Proteobacteria bacterium]|nr:DUF4331 family protein [Pseudomonadota bacterium]
MSHHYSGPVLGFPQGDARLDLTDLYAFAKPGDPTRSILILNAHPSFSLEPRGPTRTDPFAPDALYEVKIDTDGDLVADIAYRVRFSDFECGVQTASIRRAVGADAAGTGDTGEVLITAAPVSLGATPDIVEGGGHRVFAGWRSDAFFFDVLGVLDGFNFSHTDFFADKDVCSIVLDVPNVSFGSGKIGIWARTLFQRDGHWATADRGGRPGQTPFLAGDVLAAYNAAEPAQDRQFIPAFAHALEHTGGYAHAEALRVAATLLPDVLSFDPARPTAFPDNGRALTDDVQDHFLAILTNGKVTSDGVGPHDDLLEDFPYLGPPHAARSSAPDGSGVAA